MPSRSSAPAVTASAPERLPGDPLDPVRARQGRRFINVVLIGALLLYLGVAGFAFGPNGAGLGPMNRLLGWDSPVLAAVPLLLLFWVPMFVLRRLPRRTENSFLCGAQDAIDPARNPNWRRREGSDEALVRWLRRLRRGALIVAATAVLVAGVAYRIASRQPPEAGRTLPRLSVAALARSGDRALPTHARIVAAVPGYGQAWIHAWSIRRTSYEDVYLPLRPPGQRADAPVAVVEKATYVASYESLRSDPPVAPFEGELSRASYPAWMTQRMRAGGLSRPAIAPAATGKGGCSCTGGSTT